MLELRIIRENTDSVKAGMKLRNLPDSELVKIDRILQLDDQRKESQQALD